MTDDPNAPETRRRNAAHFNALAAYWLGAAAAERRTVAKAGLGAGAARQEHANCLDLARHCRGLAAQYAKPEASR